MVLEVKYSLYRGNNSSYLPCPCKRAVHQISQTKNLFDQFLMWNVELNNWKFIGAIGFIEHSENEKQHIKFCDDCKKFLVQKDELKSFFKYYEDHLTGFNDEEGYKKVVAKLLFTSFAFPLPLLRFDMDERHAIRVKRPSSQ